MVELIKKKKNGIALNKQEIDEMVEGFVSGKIPDYQVSAFLMAVYFKGMTKEETALLTDAMKRSGDVVDLSAIPGIKVDKHSTGGVGDKTTLILGPLVAAAGVTVVKMSGRGLGHTGGTLDKLQCVPDLNLALSGKEFAEKLAQNGFALSGQNKRLVPADKKLYALRDVTATVDSLPLIASSIMSKKLACGADAIIIDLKVGSGAYMKTEADAIALAKIFNEIGALTNKSVISVITAMEEPLGLAVGNTLEVIEAIETLKGNGPEDLTNLCYELGSDMLLLAKAANSREEAIEKLKKAIASGDAYQKFLDFVRLQDGNVESIKNYDLLPSAQYTFEFKSEHEGYITNLDALKVGLASVALGAGRATAEASIDKGAGIVLQKKTNDFVQKDDVLAVLYADHQAYFEKAIQILKPAYTFGNSTVEKMPLVLNRV